MKELNTEIACVRLGSVYVVPVTSPEIAMEFLRQNDAVMASRPITVTTSMFSDGFLTAVVAPWGKQWKKMRKVLTHEILNPTRLEWLRSKRKEEADNLLQVVNNICKSGSVVDVRLVSRHFTGNILRRMMFNKRYYRQGREDGGPCVEEQEHIKALFTVLLYVYALCVSDYLPILKPLDLDGHEKTVRNALNVIKKYEDPIINERVEMWKEGKRTEPEDLLDVFISVKDDNGKPLLSVAEIKAQITELFLATLDNPSNIAEWALAEMLNQPEQLQKAVEELDRVVGKERLVEESDIPNLSYVVACARESLRLHPIAPFNLPHVAKEDLTVAGYFIPKGSQVLLSRLGLGRNPRVWEDPLRFNPERHFKDNSHELGLAEPGLRFISFTRGRRGCMGGTLGTLITVMLFARLLQGFTWRIPPELEKIDLKENDRLFLAKPLHVYAEPRLPAHLYPA
uniref:Cytochrome P450 n=2 Tax=Quercus lobata TaxID=97700 RepID=A0A7N2KLF6_QUELO